MKKIILFSLPILLTACFPQATKPSQAPANPIVSSEIMRPTETAQAEPNTIPVKTAQKPPVVKKPTTTNTVPDEKTDDMTKELDSLIDDIVSGK